MRIREFFWRFSVALAVFALSFALGVILMSCGGSGSVSGPDPAPTAQAAAPPAQVAATPTVVAGPTPDPSKTLPYLEWIDRSLGRAWLINPTNHPVEFVIEFFDATNFHNQTLLLKLTRTVEAKKTLELEEARIALLGNVACGKSVTVQLDISTTVHIGHSIFTLTTEACCVEKWEELEPEITYTDWSECKRNETSPSVQAACSQSRTKTIVIKEQNTCTKEIREKSRKSEQESRPCECACVESWVKLPPVVTYGEWSECGPVPTSRCTDSSCVPTCQQTRKVRTVIEEENTCTKARRVFSDVTTTESQACECKKDILGFCHISNKGKDGNVNLVVSFKQAGEGHEKHTEAPFCPKDRIVWGSPGFDMSTKPPKPPEFECKLEGGPLTELYCDFCKEFIEEAKACPSVVTE